MEVNGQFHTLNDLLLGKKPPVPIGQKDGSGCPELIGMMWRSKKSLAPTTNWTLILQSSSPWPTCCINWAILKSTSVRSDVIPLSNRFIQPPAFGMSQFMPLTPSQSHYRQFLTQVLYNGFYLLTQGLLTYFLQLNTSRSWLYNWWKQNGMVLYWTVLPQMLAESV